MGVLTMTILALATLGDATKNRNDPISVMLPKVAKAGIEGAISPMFSPTNVASVHLPWILDKGEMTNSIEIIAYP